MSSVPIARLLTNAIAPALLAAERHAASLYADMTTTDERGDRSSTARVIGAASQMIAVAKPLFGGWVIFPMLAPLGLAQLVLIVWLLWKGMGHQNPG